MYRTVSLVALILTLTLTACRASTAEDEATPTAFPREEISQRVTTAAPIPISLENLASNPDFFVGATLELTGQYTRLPRLACDAEAFPSPATWGLVDAGYLVNASGMDRQLRSLIDEGQTITVQGQWLKYTGQIGCGATAREQDLWFLSADRVLDPHPLVRRAGTANDGNAEGTAVAELPPTAEQVPAGEATVQVLATETPLPMLSPLPSTPTLTTEPSAFGTPTVEGSDSSNTATPAALDTGTPTVLSTQLAGTTPPAGSPTSTPSGGSQSTVTVTPTITNTPTSGGVIERGPLDTEDLTIRTLAANSSDRWTLDLAAGEAITITVAPAQMANVVLSLVDPGGNALVNEQNNSPIGEVESFHDVAIAEPGSYDLIVRTEQGMETDYALMLMDSESYSFDFRGRLTANGTRSDSLPADHDHFWFFVAQSGETVTFSVRPSGASDPYLELYDPDGARMLTIDDTGESEVESLDDYTLSDAGMYGIRVAEFDFRPMSYQISLSRN